MAHQDLALPLKVSAFGQGAAGALSALRAATRSFRDEGRAEEERLAMVRFAALLNSLGDLNDASSEMHSYIVETIKRIAGRVDVGRCSAGATYSRRVLHEDVSGWSIAAISLRPGQATPSHDHGGWGCAVTVKGIERDRRFVDVGGGVLEIISERDYPPGTGYSFGPTDIHQPVGADPTGLTVALHFLIHGRQESAQHHAETKPKLHLVGNDASLFDEAA
jgi:predicted metal-dependent enzyme (double-stranded beta helix superfamily)